MTQLKTSRIILALDYADKVAAFALVEKITPDLCKLKIGKEMFVRYGPSLVKELVSRGYDVFLDLKFHDIPNTVAGACAAAADLGIWMLNIHITGGRRMMEAAQTALLPYSKKPLLIGVTVLTSIENLDLQEIGLSCDSSAWVLSLATLGFKTGLDGVVCSAMEAEILRQQTSKDFKLVTPGIRFSDSSQQDQRRVMTPVAAIKAGADYLVIGRSVTQSADPVSQLLTINSEINRIS